jgi:hypothetical protein
MIAAMRLSRPRLVAIAFLLAIVTSLLGACSGGGFSPPPTATAPPLSSVIGAATAAAAVAQGGVAPPTATPPAPSPTAASGVTFNPPELVQGGVTIVYLHETATSATVRFQNRQYPMLRDGNRWWAILGVGAFAEPGLHPLTIAYTPTAQSEPRNISQSVAVRARTFEVEHIELEPSTAALLSPENVQAENNRRATIFSGYTTQRLWSGAFVKPAQGAISSSFGEGRSYNRGPVTDYHRGTDFIGEVGDPVVAAAAGRVVFTGELRVRGNAVIIDHGAGVFSAYHHLSRINVGEGQSVAPGQLIGAVGRSGLVTGPHLHWEVVVRGVEVDGELWLQGREVGP